MSGVLLLGSRRSLRRSGMPFLGLEEELKEEWSAPPWALGGAWGGVDAPP